MGGSPPPGPGILLSKSMFMTEVTLLHVGWRGFGARAGVQEVGVGQAGGLCKGPAACGLRFCFAELSEATQVRVCWAGEAVRSGAGRTWVTEWRPWF